MEQDILNTVFEVEREIRETVAAEQQRADGALAALRRECAELAAGEEARLREEMAAGVAAVATGEARRQADVAVGQAEARAGRLARLGDDRLARLVRHGIGTILPGE
ncbi:hypothetical protein FO488_03340 [Geobacter sp. FeAm09]|uniref:hypothetical protein n=1 Tax=Geobacter sp. FeAm09 TaxID=2597769 RepID=UPI0011F08086|nr:hypothetical protein [Geobacter sp. FeAm09]QEM67280.1 hypothetical protein FO488_03340 [Geobacter sp. FeAm09]